jgi:predicted nucleotide-binding protein
MARQFTTQPTKQPARLMPQEMQSGIKRLNKCLESVRNFDPQSVADQHHTPELDALEASIEEALVLTFGADTLEYDRYKSARDFNRGPYNYAYKVPPHEFQKSIARSKESSIALLRQLIKSLEERLEEHSTNPLVNQTSSETPRLPARKVFIVHGHDEAALQAVARFLEQIGLEAIILREQPDQGRATIEKFEDCASQVGFAVVLMTPDDVAGSVDAPGSAARARQNVIFELGYFAGKLGRGRACLLRKGNVEIPSDLYGVIYTDFDEADGWKLKLVRELKAAKVDFDANRMLA